MEQTFSIVELASIILGPRVEGITVKYIADPIDDWKALRETSTILRIAIDRVSRSEIAELLNAPIDLVPLDNAFGLYNECLAVEESLSWSLYSSQMTEEQYGSLQLEFYLKTMLRYRCNDLAKHLIVKSTGLKINGATTADIQQLDQFVKSLGFKTIIDGRWLRIDLSSTSVVQ